LQNPGSSSEDKTTNTKSTNCTGNAITTFHQTAINVQGVSGSRQTTNKATYANDVIVGMELRGGTFQGDDGSFSLSGQYGDDYLEGNRGNDLLYGGFSNVIIPTYSKFTYEDDGTDILRGGEGNDKLYGGTGDDILDGGGLIKDANQNVTGAIVNDGMDTLEGGSGADFFVFNTTSTGIDVIVDFEVLIDKIRITNTFGATSTSQFDYDSTNGALSFNSQQFATLTNLPNGFDVNRDIILT